MADDEPGWFFGWRALLTTLMMLGRPHADAAADELDDEDVPIGATETLCANHDVCGGHGLRLENGLCIPCVDGVGVRLERSDAGDECPVCLSAVATVKQPQCSHLLCHVCVKRFLFEEPQRRCPCCRAAPPGLAAEIALREQIGEDAFAQLYAERPPVDDDDDDDDDDMAARDAAMAAIRAGGLPLTEEPPRAPSGTPFRGPFAGGPPFDPHPRENLHPPDAAR